MIEMKDFIKNVLTNIDESIESVGFQFSVLPTEDGRIVISKDIDSHKITFYTKRMQ